MTDERRVISRRKFGYYMRVIDNNTQELVGYLSDISTRGFKLDSKKQLVVNKDYSLRLDLTSDVSDRSFISFVARSKWSLPDATDPFLYNEGFQIVNISPADDRVYQLIVEKYGSPDRSW